MDKKMDILVCKKQLFFYVIEQDRSILKLLKTPLQPYKSDMIKQIVNDDDVQF